MVANIVQTSPRSRRTGNIGCIAQIASGTSIPVLHTIELLDCHGGDLDGSPMAGQRPMASRAFPAKRHFRKTAGTNANGSLVEGEELGSTSCPLCVTVAALVMREAPR